MNPSNEVELKPEDLTINTYRGHKESGFSVNVDQGVIITHKPTGAQAKCDKDRSQHKNKADAMRMLTEKVNQIYRERALIEDGDHGLPVPRSTPLMPFCAPPRVEAQCVVGPMPGNPTFTIAVFNAKEVPPGTIVGIIKV